MTMSGDELFGELPKQEKPQSGATAAGTPRLRTPERDQISLQTVDIDSLIGADHDARVIWDYVTGLDLVELEDRIKARGERPGQPATSPRLLLALWLYATSQGIGSARTLDHLCKSHDAYRWLCGGVTVNYHTLADFRVDNADLLDRLLSHHLAALAESGVIDLDALVQDGVKIRASAGAGSFRRKGTLDKHLATAQAVVTALKEEVKTSADSSSKRMAAAKERAARERSQRVQSAQKALAEIEGKRKKLEERGGNGKKPKEPRASTTDPQARVMKMADGGFRPGYNVQVVSAAGKQIVVAIDVGNTGSDGGQMRPTLERLKASKGRVPRRYIVDGGYSSAADVEWAHDQGIEVYCPPRQTKDGIDPCEPRPRDCVGVRAWRDRMRSEAGKAQYQIRTICECIHARWRNWNLRQLTVRGIEKARAAVLWYALANNVLQGYRLKSV
jgi:transposase